MNVSKMFAVILAALLCMMPSVEVSAKDDRSKENCRHREG
jgi:hypothetical protein